MKTFNEWLVTKEDIVPTPQTAPKPSWNPAQVSMHNNRDALYAAAVRMLQQMGARPDNFSKEQLLKLPNRMELKDAGLIQKINPDFGQMMTGDPNPTPTFRLVNGGSV